MRVAILDLGTNTFNLVIAETTVEKKMRIISNQKLPVKLGEGKINEGEIIPEAYQRGINAVMKQFKIIQDLNIEVIKAFGTSALRSAANGKSFLETIRNKTGIEVEIIDGNREAELIYKGVRQTINMTEEKLLMLDIGGGSNELIIADNKSVQWMNSYDLGIARLLENFRPSDPLSKHDISVIRSYLQEELIDLFKISKEQSVSTLIGASGSFETFSAMIRGIDSTSTEEALAPHSYPISIEEFDRLYWQLIQSTISERKRMKGLEPMRIEMIPLAALFVKVIIDEIGIKKIIQSNFSLKEGALIELSGSELLY